LTNITSPPTTAPAQDVQVGGSISYLRQGDIVSMDPIRMSSSGLTDGSPGFAIYDVLVYLKNGNVIPQTAQSLTSSDAVTWTLKLNPNIKFTDGTPYDAAAVKFNWQRLQDPANNATRAALANTIQQMDVVDAATLKITLKKINAVFPLSVQLMPYVASPAAIQERGAQLANNPLGAGPFMIKNWTRDSQMVVVRNPGYWRAPLPYLDQVTFLPITDESQRLNSFCAGQGTLVLIQALSFADQSEKQSCGTLRPLALNGGLPIDFNLTKAPTNDIRLRQAVAMAIDLNDYSKTVNLGLIPPATSPFRSDSPFYDPSSVQPTYDPAKAQQLFDAVAAANGGTVKLPILTLPLTEFQQAAQYIQGVLNKYKNVQATVVTKATAAFVQDMTTRAYDALGLLSTSFDDPDPSWFSLFMCNSNPSVTGWCNTQFDAAVVDSQSQLDPAKRTAAVKAAVKAHQADLPQFFLKNSYSWTVSAKNVQDFAYINDGTVLIDRMWLKR
jgi:peptide/nickel transport system substrate-binding protein